MNKINIGAEIKKVADTRRIGATELAKELGKTRSNVNDIFKRKTIDTDLLYQLSTILNFNFFELYATSLRLKAGLEHGIKDADESILNKKLKTHEKSAALQNKYINLLEEKITSLQNETGKKVEKSKR